MSALPSYLGFVMFSVCCALLVCAGFVGYADWRNHDRRRRWSERHRREEDLAMAMEDQYMKPVSDDLAA